MTTEDRVVVKVHRHNPVHHEESYKVGEHGVVLEASHRSTVRVRLDGHSGQNGNYFKVQAVKPLFTLPVRHRFVTASVLHLEKLPGLMLRDYAVWEKEPGEAKGHMIGRIMDVKEDGAGQLFSVQPYQMATSEYGPPVTRPWTAVGSYCVRRPQNSVLRIDLDHDRYLRDLSLQEIRSIGLAEDLGLE
ncbi:unnamed protein product [Cladocopium goreaui]|uniref:Sulfotransferase domain-containing protein n=1 Tax=Cladocopium goreaui TaxID=2562237 RepID=A0A9P1C996_9DINO|nr:unnamed protein product [Cladocopium goreaui]